jgi:glycosyltransferase involved in cell wall biosynthesis
MFSRHPAHDLIPPVALGGNKLVRVALDGMALRRQGRGVTRVLQQVFPLLVADPRLDCIILTTREGREILDMGSSVCFHEVPQTTQSAWEQFGLPWHARQVRADAIYSHAECGPLWGPPLLLHIPEDPFIRWQDINADSLRERVRRGYQRTTIRRGLHHASVLATSSSACQSALRNRFGPDLSKIAVVPLGVDTELFHPNSAAIRDDGIFHLSSTEARDMSTVVVRAYARALSLTPDLPDLLIAGELGGQRERICDVARECGVDRRLHLLGRISDEALRQRYASAALCVQPSLYEGFGLQPLEALACGAPLVVFPEPAVEEVVGEAAIITRDRNETSLAECIARLWSDKSQRANLRENGRRRATFFSWVRTARLLADLLVEMGRSKRTN